MDKTQKTPGISLERVHLLECSVRDVNPDSELHFDLAITDLKRNQISEKTLTVLVAFDLMKGIDNPPCHFTCTYLATYIRPAEAAMTWDEFKDHLAVAHLVPYVREFISNITTRLPLSTLMLPPLNAHHLVRNYRQLSLPDPQPLAPQI